MQNVPDNKQILVLLHGYQTPITVSIETYLEMVRWTRLTTNPEPMSLADAAAHLLPLAGIAVDVLLKTGHQDEAARLVWAAAKLREAAGGE